MQLNEEMYRHLDGRKFSNAYKFKIPPTQAKGMMERNRLLAALARGKDVLHVGCADHLELISEKRENGSYLHDILRSAAKSVTGIDTNATALAEMRGIGIPALYLPSELPSTLQFDIVLAPDVIEHVPNVEAFLHDLKRFDAPVVITTPNALRLQNRVRWRHEFINSDHRYWFSPYTLSKSLMSAGYAVRAIHYTDSPSLRRPHYWALARLFPACRDGLAIVAIPKR